MEKAGATAPHDGKRGKMSEHGLKNIIIVEDEQEAADLLRSFIERYGKENDCAFRVTRYADAPSFLDAYVSADIVFMDIELPGMDGLSVSALLREKDADVMIIFVTNMSRLAIRGYEVRAFDFIVKPVSYPNFSFKFRNALRSLGKRRGKDIWISNKDGKMRLNTSEIVYVEIMQHILIFHTVRGEFKATGTLAYLQKELEDEPFSMCNRCYFVNLAYVTAVRQQDMYAGDVVLRISRAKRAAFMKDLSDYIAAIGGWESEK